jgi:FtsP/CotA-like multicopper oxidase with cupredoxin domain
MRNEGVDEAVDACPRGGGGRERALSRRAFVAWVGGAAAGYYLFGRLPGSGRPLALAAAPDGPLDALAIARFRTPLLVPPVMPRAGTIVQRGGKNVDYYEISVRQLSQQMLPPGMPPTTVWGYGPIVSGSRRGTVVHNAPSLTIEAQVGRPVRVRWVNELVDESGAFLPHLLAVDPTLHWANPPGGETGRDTRPVLDAPPEPYHGPVPMVVHVHGAVGVGDESDGYAEAWFLPAASNLPDGYARAGTWHGFFAAKAAAKGITAPGASSWEPGTMVAQYPNEQRAATLWYHDHTLGMTRLNVYAGPAGFFLVRGGPAGDDAVTDTRTGARAVLPGPAPREGDRPSPGKRYGEIAMAIQDRSFRADGSLFYPDSRAFFDGIVHPYVGDGDGDDPAPHGADEMHEPHEPHEGFPPIWNPEFFGNTLIVNGVTWPYLDVERRRYRLRLLNGCQSRFLILSFDGIPGAEVWQIGNEGGLLPAPVDVSGAHGGRVLLAPAERADVILDLTAVPAGTYVVRNLGPDEPFGGGEPGVDFEPADPSSTGQVLQLRVGETSSPDPSTPPRFLGLPPVAPLPEPELTRGLALIESAATGRDEEGEEAEGPIAALLGVVDGDGVAVARMWSDPVTESPAVGAVERWEIFNTTMDAHPIHLHDVVFQVEGRQPIAVDEERMTVTPTGEQRGPEPWETGFKETVIAYPGEVTRLRARFENAGQYTWHCHIVEHEDNEMMRPYRIGPVQPGQPG